jgi:hypothetical protein
MKWRIENCPRCKEDTKHRVRKRLGIGKKPKGKHKEKSGSGAYIKYIVYHCCKCNQKIYR